MHFSGLTGGHVRTSGPVRAGARALRTTLATVVLAGALALGGCDPEMIEVAKHLKPLTPQMLKSLEEKGMSADAPMLVRLFKEESELEVWKQTRNGQYALLKTYPICRWSGELGPKIKEGDRQAPEGFYTVSRGQLNPNSSYYLSFDTGYPNAYDRAWGRTGSQLMVHGDCSSRGCYAMTDDQIGEIYSLARESIMGGQRSFQLQAYPFRMTALNMAKHRDNPHFAFWKMLKEGNDHFEATRQQVKVDVCEKRYVFNAETGAMSSFQPTGQCPAYEVPAEIASAVASKSKRDDGIFAALVKKNTPTLPIKTGRDGGMNPVFVAQLRPQEVRDEKGNVRIYVENAKAAKVSSYTPSAAAEPEIELASAAPATTASTPAAAPKPIQVASADPDAPILATAEAVPMPRPAPARAGAANSLVNRGAGSAGADSGDTTGKTPSASAASIFASSAETAKSTLNRATSSVAGVFGIGTPEGNKGKAADTPPATTSPAVPSPRSAPLVAAAAVPAPKPAPVPAGTTAPAKPQVTATASVPPPAKPATVVASKPEAPKPAAARTDGAKPRPQQTAEATPRNDKPGLVSGAQPVLATGSFR